MRSRYRYLILASAVLMQACLGATYSWSIFAQAMRDQVGLARAQLPFTVFYIAFPATMLSSGLLLRKLGPRGCAVLGGSIFGIGWMVASLGEHAFPITLLGVGVLGGIGVGTAYVIPISVGMQWFPDHKGLVTGIIVAGFGGGAALVTQVASRLMADAGWSAFEVLRLLGAIFAITVAVAGLLVRYPDREQARLALHNSDLRAGEVIGDPLFRMLYLAMFAGLAAGFAVNSNLRQLCPSLDAQSGALAVAIFALANAAGRVGWGWSFDNLLATGAIRLNLLAQAAVLLASPLLIRTPHGLQVLAALAGFNYGGMLVLYASATAQKWGAHRVGRIYGWLFSANIPASIAPFLAAASFDRLHTFTPALLLLAAVVATGALLFPGRTAPVGETAGA